ncbi:D-alanyl-D-alanine carboxypeptidase family protein [Candidatus Nomurabacteria bacterium]|nr:D-alanyl-D-alanine carboxypeptidase family protein [Candidatus Nomurabacteria bacterium]
MKQIRKVLSRDAWSSVKIYENGETLVLLEENPKLKLGIIKKSYEQKFFVRKSIADKLYKVSESLPDNLSLVVIEGYRSVGDQQKSWLVAFNNIKKLFPKLSNEEIERKTSMVIARPNLLANHNCGGAIDVTLADKNGNLLDMGSPYPSLDSTKEERTRFPMFPKSFLFFSLLTKNQRKNRKILRKRMESQGFVWYPGEWWHYCYGDRMWAVYTGRNSCIYGPASIE